MPPPIADPMPPSDFAFCMRMTRVIKTETSIRARVNTPRRMFMTVRV
jgi:hypothetical protein